MDPRNLFRKPPEIDPATPTEGEVTFGKLDEIPTLIDQLEDLLTLVWDYEREWKLDDRIALGARLAERENR